MKKNILVFMALLLCVSTYVQARTLSPTFSIRYEDFVKVQIQQLLLVLN